MDIVRRQARVGGHARRGIVWNGEDLSVVDDLEVKDCGAGEVRVRVVNSGVCHSDVVVGDHVVISTLGNCGHCRYCGAGKPTMCRQTFDHYPKPFTCGGEAHYAFANVWSFAQYTVVKAQQAVTIPEEIPFPSA